MEQKVLVIGSLNIDFTYRCKRLPLQGETIHCEDQFTSFGGKGANQAIAARQCYEQVYFAGALGNDSLGKNYRNHLHHLGLSDEYIETVDTPTGTAVILMGHDDNMIVVNGGSNFEVNDGLVKRAIDTLQPSVLVCQLEVPLQTVQFALEYAHGLGIKTILNAAPMPLGFPREILESVDCLIVNETELAELTGIENGLIPASSLVLEFGAASVISTLGSKGCIYLDRTQTIELPSYPIQVIDTTGAGDTFVGVYASCLALSLPVIECLKNATAAASLCCMNQGAQNLQLNTENVQRFIRENE